MSQYYDRQGRHMSMEEWTNAFEGDRHIAKTELPNGVTISTVWLGLDHSFDEGPPLIFETMAFPPDKWRDLDSARYSTEEQAKAGHEAMCARWKDKTPQEIAKETEDW